MRPSSRNCSSRGCVISCTLCGICEGLGSSRIWALDANELRPFGLIALSCDRSSVQRICPSPTKFRLNCYCDVFALLHFHKCVKLKWLPRLTRCSDVLQLIFSCMRYQSNFVLLSQNIELLP